MKLKESNIESIVIGERKAKQFSIGDDKIIYDILRNKLYKDPIAAICREISSNSRDANREAEKNREPVRIEIIDGAVDIGISSDLSIAFHDNGPGITPDRMDDIFIVYGKSTKRDTNEQTGGYGLGAKTPFAYSDTFSVKTVCDFNGKRMKYFYVAAIDEDEKGTMYLFREEETTDGTGTTVTVPIKKTDRRQFEDDVVNYTMAWEFPPLIKNFSYRKTIPTIKRFKFPDFEIFINLTGEPMFDHCGTTVILIDGIPYPVPDDYSELDNFGPGTVVIPFPNGVFDLSGGREDLQSTKSNFEILSKKAKVIKDFTAKWISDFMDEAENPYRAALRYVLLQPQHGMRNEQAQLASTMFSINKIHPTWKGKNLRDILKIKVEEPGTIRLYYHTLENFEDMDRKTTVSRLTNNTKFFDTLLSMHDAKSTVPGKYDAYSLEGCNVQTQRLNTVLQQDDKTTIVKRLSLEEFLSYNGYTSSEAKIAEYPAIFAEETKFLQEFFHVTPLKDVVPTPFNAVSPYEKKEYIEIRFRAYTISSITNDRDKPSISYNDVTEKRSPKKEPTIYKNFVVMQATSVSEHGSTNINSDLIRFLLGVTAGSNFRLVAASRSYNTIRKMGAITPEEYMASIDKDDVSRIKKTHIWTSTPKIIMRLLNMRDKLNFDEEDKKKMDYISHGSKYSVDEMFALGRAIKFGDEYHVQKSGLDMSKIEKPSADELASVTDITTKYPMLLLCNIFDDVGAILLDDAEITTINDYLKIIQDGKKGNILGNSGEQHDHLDEGRGEREHTEGAESRAV